ncbi:MAG: SH3 domain-containing protein [Anaerolineae bacterium]|nr:SH3 domain-containing protein [Anaerolineae bacterium]
MRADRRNVQALAIAAVPIVVLLVVIVMGIILVRGRSGGTPPEATATHFPTTGPTALVAAVRTSVATDTPVPVVNTPTPEPTSNPVETPTPAEPTATPTPSDELVEGAVAVVSDTAGRGLRMRSGPGLDSPTLRVMPEGTEVQILGGPSEMDGYQWYHILDDANTEGWVAGDWLVRIR